MIKIIQLTLRLLVMSWILAKRQLIHNRTAQRNTWNQSYDFIVVGAGTAGCVVANRITQDPNVNVLLLEAGGAQDVIWTDLFWLLPILDDHRPDVDWHYYDEPQTNAGQSYPGGRINQFMGKVIGGSSTHNFMFFNRGNRRGYDNWAKQYGAFGWSYADVMPYFLKYENNTDQNLVHNEPDYHNIKGPVQISSQRYFPRLLRSIQNAYNDLGYQNTDINGPNQTGTMFPQKFIDSQGFRVSSGMAYVDPNPHPNNLHIVTRALVTRILFNGTKAVGVEFNRNDTSYQVYARKEVILSAGAYNTPQLLMLSGVGKRDHLQQFGIQPIMDLPVGDNLMNHPIIIFYSQIMDPEYYLPQTPQVTLQQLFARFINNTGPLGTNPLNALSWNTDHKQDYPNALSFNTFANERALLNWVSLYRVRSRGSVRLQSSSPYIAPRIDSNFLGDSRDFNDILNALRFIMFILESPRFGLPISISTTFESLGCPVCVGKYMYECTVGLNCFIRQLTSSIYHPCGTCRMGAVNRQDVVVDPRLMVKNLMNLRVCDASIFPEIPNANTAAATFMTGEKCAQIIKQSHHLKFNDNFNSSH